MQAAHFRQVLALKKTKVKTETAGHQWRQRNQPLPQKGASPLRTHPAQ
jgi:hypothetical protein